MLVLRVASGYNLLVRIIIYSDMLRRGHTGMSLLVSAPFTGLLLAGGFVAEAIVFTGSLLAGGGLPDVDTRVPVVKHRGFLHTVWFGLIYGVLLGIVSLLVLTFLYTNNSIVQSVVDIDSLQWIAVVSGVGGFAGVLSHLLGDMITPWGINPFEPVDDRKVKFELTKASNESSNTALLIVGFVAMIGAFVYGGTHLVGGGGF
ncbi:metal-dependent hydrolase [Halorubrum sp. ASP1]|uniref:metal-dependent hydrolase n=1 Tax=Halorubrum sp. ASP1 TaxID=2518114 RepID=UPI001305158C|nr:metal-dependent hydrolase [Halorubrum sp. ASP1]